MTEGQRAKIKDNLDSFKANFGDVRIEKADYGSDFFVFYPPDDPHYVQRCDNIDYLNGWLYGVVQGNIIRARNIT